MFPDNGSWCSNVETKDNWMDLIKRVGSKVSWFRSKVDSGRYWSVWISFFQYRWTIRVSWRKFILSLTRCILCLNESVKFLLVFINILKMVIVAIVKLLHQNNTMIYMVSRIFIGCVESILWFHCIEQVWCQVNRRFSFFQTIKWMIYNRSWWTSVPLNNLLEHLKLRFMRLVSSKFLGFRVFKLCDRDSREQRRKVAQCKLLLRWSRAR